MKIKLLLATALVAVGCTVWLASAATDKTAEHIAAMKADGSLTNVVQTLVRDGTICAIRGHVWEGGCGNPGCLVLHQNPIRHCTICRAVQSQKVGAWE